MMRLRIALLCVLALPACTERPQAAIGHVLPQGWGAQAMAAVRDAVDSLPASQRARIRFVQDTTVPGGPTDREIEYAERIASRSGIVAVVGHGGSRESLVAAPVYNEAGIVHVVPTGTSRLLQEAGPWTFALPPDERAEGTFLAEEIVARWAPGSVSVFFENDAYGRGLAEAVRTALRAREVDIIDASPMARDGDVDVVVEGSLSRGRPDVIVAVTRERETARIARALLARGVDVPVVAGDGAFIFPSLAEMAGPAAANIWVAGFWNPLASDSVSAAFVRRFRRVNGVAPHPSHAMAYDALMLLVTAVIETGPSAERVRAYLLELGGSRPAYRGVTGAIDFRSPRAGRFVLLNAAAVAGAGS